MATITNLIIFFEVLSYCVVFFLLGWGMGTKYMGICLFIERSPWICLSISQTVHVRLGNSSSILNFLFNGWTFFQTLIVGTQYTFEKQSNWTTSMLLCSFRVTFSKPQINLTFIVYLTLKWLKDPCIYLDSVLIRECLIVHGVTHIIKYA